MTGPAQDSTMNVGWLYRRQMNEPIKNFVLVTDFDKVLAKVGWLGE